MYLYRTYIITKLHVCICTSNELQTFSSGNRKEVGCLGLRERIALAEKRKTISRLKRILAEVSKSELLIQMNPIQKRTCFYTQ